MPGLLEVILGVIGGFAVGAGALWIEIDIAGARVS